MSGNNPTAKKRVYKKTESPSRPQDWNRSKAKAFLERTIVLAEPLWGPLNLELAWAEAPLIGGRLILRFFIDHPNGDQPVTLGDCSAFSRALDDLLEETEWAGDEVPEFSLEVSSPGLDRPLLKQADYHRFTGRLIKLKLRREGRSVNLKGHLALTPENEIILETTEGPFAFAFEEVLSARLIWEP